LLNVFGEIATFWEIKKKIGVKLGVSRLGETSLEGVSVHRADENTQRDIRTEKQENRENCTSSIIIITFL
jgi:hypothetical protein